MLCQKKIFLKTVSIGRYLSHNVSGNGRVVHWFLFCVSYVKFQGSADLVPDSFKKMKLTEYKCPFCIFPSGENKLLLIFCKSSWLQKSENGSYETLILPCGL